MKSFCDITSEIQFIAILITVSLVDLIFILGKRLPEQKESISKSLMEKISAVTIYTALFSIKLSSGIIAPRKAGKLSDT